ncbi:MAG: hypothetical protein FJ197_05565 [Gammaproteobacteria bacterium]|nr:hypothetical protein [Gammaproteobacteria bacterium]
MGNYSSLDLRIARIFALPESRLETWLEVTGALAERKPCCYEYESTEGGGGPVITRETEHWPRIIPSVGVLWSF